MTPLEAPPTLGLSGIAAGGAGTEVNTGAEELP